MQEVATAIERQIGSFEPGLFTDAATKWSAHALRTYTGELLRRALALSQALVEFEIVLERGEDSRPAGA